MTRDDRNRRRGFVRDVMSRTSGTACDRALAALPALTDGELAGLDRPLVQQHLEHCDGCRAVALALGRLGHELPELADLDPGPGFTAAVLARTSARTPAALERRRARVARAGPGGLMDRLGRWWGENVLRPQFALQAAYVATVLCVLVFATPYSPLRGTPTRVLEAVQAAPGPAPLMAPALRWTSMRIDDAREDVLVRWEAAKRDGRERAARSAPARRAVGTHIDAALRAAGERRAGDVTVELNGALTAARTAWSAWWHADAGGGTRGLQQRSEP